MSFVSYVLILDPIVSYWATREIARGGKSGKTAFVSNGFFSLIGMIAYIIIISIIGPNTDANQTVLWYGLLLIPSMFINKVLSAINLGWKPHVTSYGLITIGISQVPLAFIFVYVLQMGVVGVIVSVTIANILSNVVLSIYAYEKIKNEFQIKFFKKWIRLFWIPTFPGIVSLIPILDIALFAVITGSVEGIAFWSSAFVLSIIITNLASISRATYPKLLQDNEKFNIKENISHMFYFAFPLLAFVLVFGRPALFLFNPIYEIAFPILVFQAIHVFFSAIAGVFQFLLMGVEKIDMDKNSKIKDYLKSKLFFVPSVLLIQYVMYIGIISILFTLNSDIPQIDLIFYWSIIFAITQIPFTVYFYFVLKKNGFILLDKKRIIKYLTSSLVVFGLLFLLMESTLEYVENIFEFVPNLLIYALIGLGGYLVITLGIDKNTRILASAILNEIRK